MNKLSNRYSEGEILVGAARVNGGDQIEGKQLMDFISICEIK
jgi:hypothetical protein